MTDEVHGIFDLVFQVGGERPIAEAEPAADQIDPAVGIQQQVVEPTPEHRQPLAVLDDGVEFVTVHHQQPPTVRGFMDDVGSDAHAAEHAPDMVAEHLVVVARHEYHLAAARRLSMIAWMTRLWVAGQYQPLRRFQKSIMSPTR